MTSTNELLQMGIQAAKSNDVDAARRFLRQVLEQDPRNETAWLWLSSAVETDEQRMVCLENVLAIHPDHQAAQRGLDMLEQKTIKSLPEITAKPPSPSSPPVISRPRATRKPILSRETMGCSIALIVLLIAFIALALITDRSLGRGGVPASPVQKPTPTVTPKLAAPPLEVRLYMQEVAAHSETFGQALTDLGELMQYPRVNDEDWLLAVAAQIVIIRLTHQDLVEMNIPPEMADVHNALLDATSDCNRAMDYLTSGVDNRSPTDLETGAELMTSCGEKMSRSSEMLEEYMARFGW